MADTTVEINRTKIRAGLAMITLIFFGSAVAFLVLTDTFARAIFFAVAIVAVIRVWLLVTTLRRESKAAQSPTGLAA